MLSILKLKLKQLCYLVCDVGYRYWKYKETRKLFTQCYCQVEKDFSVSFPYRIIGAQYMKIGESFSSLPGLRIECIDTYDDQHFSPKLIIGDGVSFNYYCHVGCINKIVIGNHVMVGSYVLITDHSHGGLERTSVPVAKRKLLSKGPVIIGDNVWIGEHACIMPGVTIGEGSIIGANAVVTHDVPPYSVAVGVPAKVVKQL